MTEDKIINGKALYTPKGAAMEYGRIGCNFYTGCPHECEYCVSPDTQVFMADGSSKRIDDIEVGDEIYGVEKQPTNYYAMTKAKVTAKAEVMKCPYRLTFSNGQHVVCSDNHRFLTNRGWKYTSGTEFGYHRRPFLTESNRMVCFPEYPVIEFEITDEYRRGYLSGIIRGDANLAEYHHDSNSQYLFRLALKEQEAVDRTSEYLLYFGIEVRCFDFPMVDRKTKKTINHKAIRKNGVYNYEKIQSLIVWETNSREWLRGFMAGIYDAEGGKDNAKRMSNSNQQIIDTYCLALEEFGFNYTFDKPQRKGNGKLVQIVRLKGGMLASLRFLRICRPAITSLFDFEGMRLKFAGPSVRLIEKKKLTNPTRLIDIETTIGNFFANGIVAHNCYLKRGITGKALGGTEVRLKKCFKDEKHALQVFRNEVMKHRDRLRETGVFFSFTTDPMIPETIELTMQSLLFLQDMGIPSYILTKNADFIDYELFHTYMFGLNMRSLLHFGFTLTGRDDMESKASLNANRIATMKRLKLHFGCHTWASIEPVIDWKSAERVVLASIPYCDHYKIGLRSGVKKDYYNHAETFERVSFLVEVITKAYRDVYLKQSVRTFIGNDNNVTLSQFESLVARTVDMDGKPFLVR